MKARKQAASLFCGHINQRLDGCRGCERKKKLENVFKYSTENDEVWLSKDQSGEPRKNRRRRLAKEKKLASGG